MLFSPEIKKNKNKTKQKPTFKRQLGQSRLSVQVYVFIIRIITFETDDGIDHLLVVVTLKIFGFVLNNKKNKIITLEKGDRKQNLEVIVTYSHSLENR